MNTVRQSLQKPAVSIPIWLTFIAFNVFVNFYFQLFWIGLADELFHYTAAAILAVLLTIFQFSLLPRMRPYLWGRLPLILLAGFWILAVFSLLIEQCPLGNELTPLGLSGNLSLIVILLAYILQIWLLCVRLKR